MTPPTKPYIILIVNELIFQTALIRHSNFIENFRSQIKYEQEGKYKILKNSSGDFLFAIRCREENVCQPVIFYDGGEHALLYRNTKNIIILDYLHPGIRDALIKSGRILIIEIALGKIVREYNVPVRAVKKTYIEESGLLQRANDVDGETRHILSVNELYSLYDQALTTHRNILNIAENDYSEQAKLKDTVLNYVTQAIYDNFLYIGVSSEKDDVAEEVLENLIDWCNQCFPIWIKKSDIKERSRDVIEKEIVGRIEKAYSLMADIEQPEIVEIHARKIIKDSIEDCWREHVSNMDDLRQTITTQSYDAASFSDECGKYLSRLLNSFYQKVCASLFRCAHDPQIFEKILHTFGPEFSNTENVCPTATHSDPMNALPSDGAPGEEIELPKVTIRREAPKMGRNDPCPCGSGKKYKNCHGAM